MNKIKLVNTLLLVALLVCALYMLGFSTVGSTRVAYMDLPKAFEAFDMKKALQSKLESELKEKNKVLDSLKLSLGYLPMSTDTEKGIIAAKRNELLQVSESFQLQHQQSIKDYDQQIMNRLNQYVKEYADKKGYDFILGAEGSGVIMAANESLDVTTDLIGFINQKYQGE